MGNLPWQYVTKKGVGLALMMMIAGHAKVMLREIESDEKNTR